MLNIVSYHLSKNVALPFGMAIETVTDELKKEGFGVISYIDLKETFKKKINKDFRNYVILGACNPRYAFEALTSEDKVGVFLPCNVVVQEHDNGQVEVSIVNPEELMEGVDDPSLRTFATEIKEAMTNVLNRL